MSVTPDEVCCRCLGFFKNNCPTFCRKNFQIRTINKGLKRKRKKE